MTPTEKRALRAACVPLVLVPLMFWIAGYDFNERGLEAFACLFATLFFSGLVFLVVKFHLEDSQK